MQPLPWFRCSSLSRIETFNRVAPPQTTDKKSFFFCCFDPECWQFFSFKFKLLCSKWMKAFCETSSGWCLDQCKVQEIYLHLRQSPWVTQGPGYNTLIIIQSLLQGKSFVLFSWNHLFISDRHTSFNNCHEEYQVSITVNFSKTNRGLGKAKSHLFVSGCWRNIPRVHFHLKFLTANSHIDIIHYFFH